MKSLGFILVVLICLSNRIRITAQVNGQTFPSSQTLVASSDLEDLDKRKLVVVIVEPDNKMLSHLSKKPALYKAYINGIAACNNNLKEVINKKWRVGGGVEYKTIQEIEAIPNKSEYVVAFYFMAGKSSYNMFTGTCKIPTYKLPLYFTKNILEKDSTINEDCQESSVQLGISFLNTDVPFFSKVLFDIFPTKTDLMGAISTLMLQCKKGNIAFPSADNAKNKTLLIRNDMLDPRFIKEDDIKKNSPLHYKIVSRDELDEHVMAGDTNYVFVYFDDDYLRGSRQGNVSSQLYPNGAPSPTIICNTSKKIMGISSNSNFYFIAESQEKYQRAIKQLSIQPEDFKSWSGFIKR